MTPLPAQHLLKKQLLCLQHQAVRDLAWCCFSAPLMQATNTLPSINAELWQWLAELDRTPAVLDEFLSQRKSIRLGLYYEALWHFYFDQQPHWELLAYNQQVDDAGITRGAFDFLCRYDDEFFHIETAVKFYLRVADKDADDNRWQHWVGPGGEDRLDIKLQHLQQHQLLLGDTAAGKAYLAQAFPGIKKWHRHLCMQGYLFYATPQQLIPHSANPDHAKGQWFYPTPFFRDTVFTTQAFWLVLERHRWLSPAQTIDINQILTAGMLREQIDIDVLQMKRPLLIAAMKQVGEIWQESERFFIVPPAWPTAAR